MKRFFLLLFVMIFCITGKLFSATLTIIYDDGNEIEIGTIETKTTWNVDDDIVNFDDNDDYEDIGSQFTLVDANSDGYMDIMENIEFYSGAYNHYYNLYIYNPKEKKFELLEELYNLHIEGNGIIREGFWGNNVSPSYTTYKWDGNRFRKLSKYYYSSFPPYWDAVKEGEIIYSWDEDDEKIIKEEYKYYNRGEEISKEEYERLTSEIYDDSTW